MAIRDEIEAVLKATFSPQYLEVTDESYKHAGHAGNPDGKGETHFMIMISLKDIPGSGRLEKHRAVMNVLSDIMQRTHSIEVRMV